jgi:hypothetical protein
MCCAVLAVTSYLLNSIDIDTPSARAMRASVSMPAAVCPFSIFESMPRLMLACSDTCAMVSPWRWRSSLMADPTDSSIETAGLSPCLIKTCSLFLVGKKVYVARKLKYSYQAQMLHKKKHGR